MTKEITITNKVTMTTVEISELTGKRKDHVKRDAERMLLELHGKDNLPKFGEVYITEKNQEYPCFRLPKREVMILVSGYSVSLRAAIIDRLDYLESQSRSVLPDFTKPHIAARAWADVVEKKLELAEKIEKQKPKVDYYDDLVNTELLTSFRNTAIELQVPERKLINFLIDNKYIYRKKGKLYAYARYNKKLFVIKDWCNGFRAGHQTLVTVEGKNKFRQFCEDIVKED